MQCSIALHFAILLPIAVDIKVLFVVGLMKYAQLKLAMPTFVTRTTFNDISKDIINVCQQSKLKTIITTA